MTVESPITARSYVEADKAFFHGAALVLCIDDARQMWCTTSAEAHVFFFGVAFA